MEEGREEALDGLELRDGRARESARTRRGGKEWAHLLQLELCGDADVGVCERKWGEMRTRSGERRQLVGAVWSDAP